MSKNLDGVEITETHDRPSFEDMIAWVERKVALSFTEDHNLHMEMAGVVSVIAGWGAENVIQHQARKDRSDGDF